MTTPRTQFCSNCAYANPISNRSDLQCRRHAPVPTVGGEPNNSINWGWCDPYEWCGDWGDPAIVYGATTPVAVPED